MESDPSIWLITDFQNAYADRSHAQIDRLTADLLKELRSLDSVEEVRRVTDPEPPSGEMSGGGNLLGIVATKLSLSRVREVGGFISQKFSSKPVDIKIEANGRKIEILGVRPEDLDKVVEAAERLARG
jgi:hypothetical protein